MGDQHDQHDPDQSGDNAASTGEVLEGEIVLPEKRQYKQRAWQQKNRNGQGQNAYTDPDIIAAVVADRISGMTLRAVGEKWGVSIQTVSNWAGEDKKNRTRVEAAEARAEASQHLDTARRKAWDMYRAGEGAGHGKIMGEALNRVESVTMSKARLEGAIRPIRVDVEVHALTEAEMELQEMVREAQARAAADEQAVIDAASRDPDL